MFKEKNWISALSSQVSTVSPLSCTGALLNITLPVFSLLLLVFVLTLHYLPVENRSGPFYPLPGGAVRHDQQRPLATLQEEVEGRSVTVQRVPANTRAT